MTQHLTHNTECDNLNHRRALVPVRHCPSCGDLLNDRVGAGRCGEAHHATERRQRIAFCADCGLQLIAHG